MKTVLCFGDSNTWGYMPGTGQRLPSSQRWSGILQDKMGGGYTVIEEGLCGRTTAFDDPDAAFRSGADYLLPCLESHRPIDIVIIMLGTNDVKRKFSLDACAIAKGMEKLVKITLTSGAGRGGLSPKLLVICPPHIAANVQFDEFFGSYKVSAQLSAEYAALAGRYGCGFIDASAFISEKDLPDGVHLSGKAHLRLGEITADKVKEMLIP